MLDWLTQAFAGIVGFLADTLPRSPFADMTFDGSAVGDALGWLNWLIPFGEILTMLGLWVAAILAYRVVRFLWKHVMGKALEKVGVGA